MRECMQKKKEQNGNETGNTGGKMLLRMYDTLTKEFQCTSPISEFVKANELTKEEIDTIHDLKLNETFQIGTFTIKAIEDQTI